MGRESMKFKFEKFVETDSSFAAKVTIRQRTGQIGFNAGAINRFRVNDYKYVVLYFDPSERVVGIQLVRSEEPGSIQISKKQSNTYVTAKNFFDKFGIDYSHSHRHDLEQDTESGFLYFSTKMSAESITEDDSDDAEPPVEASRASNSLGTV
jgi:hypothetical protein